MRKSILKKLIVLTILTTTILGTSSIGVSASSPLTSNLKNWNNSWLPDGDNWSYIVDEKKVTGFKTINNQIYYFNNEGNVTHGWYKIGNEWIYTTEDVKFMTPVITGWDKINGIWYYFNSDGIMAHDTYVGKYYLGSTGACV